MAAALSTERMLLLTGLSLLLLLFLSLLPPLPLLLLLCSIHELFEQRVHTFVPCSVVELQQVAGLTQPAVNNDMQLLQEVTLVVPTAVQTALRDGQNL